MLPAGADSTIIAQRQETEITARVMGISTISLDDKIWLSFDPRTLNLYEKASGNMIVSGEGTI